MVNLNIVAPFAAKKLCLLTLSACCPFTILFRLNTGTPHLQLEVGGAVVGAEKKDLSLSTKKFFFAKSHFLFILSPFQHRVSLRD